jgi:hypothetical protein
VNALGQQLQAPIHPDPDPDLGLAGATSLSKRVEDEVTPRPQRGIKQMRRGSADPITNGRYSTGQHEEEFLCCGDQVIWTPWAKRCPNSFAEECA